MYSVFKNFLPKNVYRQCKNSNGELLFADGEREIADGER